MEPIGVDELYASCAAPRRFAELPRASFEGVLDMLSGPLPVRRVRRAAARASPGTASAARITRARRRAARSRSSTAARSPTAGSTASSWPASERERGGRAWASSTRRWCSSRARATCSCSAPRRGASSEITRDRVLVAPAPGRAGQDAVLARRPARPAARASAAPSASSRASSRRQARRGREAARSDEHGLDARAADNLVRLPDGAGEATGDCPSDRTIVVERFLDELGDWRVCVLSPFGARVHAPWAIAVAARGCSAELGGEVEAMWSDDGIVFRLPGVGRAARRERSSCRPGRGRRRGRRASSARPRCSPRVSARTRRARAAPAAAPPGRAHAALGAAQARRPICWPWPRATARSRSCWRPTASACATSSICPALVDVLRRIASRRIRVVTVDSRTPSPFASSLLFSYIANFIYDGDARWPSGARRRCRVDQAQLRELLGEAELRELLDAGGDRAARAQPAAARRANRGPARRRPARPPALARRPERGGDPSRRVPSRPARSRDGSSQLSKERRVIAVRSPGSGGSPRPRTRAGCATRWARRHRRDSPRRFSRPSTDPSGRSGLALRAHARALPPEAPADGSASRRGDARLALDRLTERGPPASKASSSRRTHARVVPTPGCWRIKRRSLARLRREVEPVEPAALRPLPGRVAGRRPPARRTRRAAVRRSSSSRVARSRRRCWKRRSCRPASAATSRTISTCSARQARSSGGASSRSARRRTHRAVPAGSHSAARCRRAEPRGRRADREHAPSSCPSAARSSSPTSRAETGAFAGDAASPRSGTRLGGRSHQRYARALRSLLPRLVDARRGAARVRGRSFRSRRLGPPGSEGRWSLRAKRARKAGPTETERSAALARTLLERYGVLTREAVARGRDRGRFLGGLSGAQGDGRGRADPPRLFRGRTRGHAVRPGGGRRPAAGAARRARRKGRR